MENFYCVYQTSNCGSVLKTIARDMLWDGHRSPLISSTSVPDINAHTPRAIFHFFPSYLPCWRDGDQKGGFLLSDLCIAHRRRLGGQVILEYLAGIIFDGLCSFLTSFHQFHCLMQWFGEELLALLYHAVDGAISYHGELMLMANEGKGKAKPIEPWITTP